MYFCVNIMVCTKYLCLLNRILELKKNYTELKKVTSMLTRLFELTFLVCLPCKDDPVYHAKMTFTLSVGVTILYWAPSYYHSTLHF